MCGIAGTYTRSGADASLPLLLTMAGDLAHRGPDGVGLYQDGAFGMANTRLAIIDLAQGDQPLCDEAGRFWVMQNGEIYNYVEIRADLKALGHRFATSSDTEVIAHAYEEWGAECLPRLNGEFAIAIWDRRRRELFLARDPFGIRPLFVSDAGGDLSFASEGKALLRHPDARRELDPLGLVDTFTLWSTLPDRTAFEGVRELPPGHLLVRGPDGHTRERAWWDATFEPREPGRSDDELAEELRHRLREATRLRLRADVPVGAYLSGGIDSSLVVALAREVLGDEVTAFGVGFADERFDERAFQDLAARSLGARLTTITVDADEIADDLPRVVELAEKPTLRTAAAPLLRLSSAVRQAGLKVVLTGEGADEIFAGYDTFREDAIRRAWARRPDERWRGMPLLRLNAYLDTDLARAAPFVLRFYERGLTETDDPLYSHRLRFANIARGLRLFDDGVLRDAAERGDPLERLEAGLPSGFGGWSPLARAQYLEIRTVLQGHLLHGQGDRMLMGHGVEGRFPYLDPDVVAFAAGLPDRAKLRGLREKDVLRRAAAPLLPPEIASRRKHPYRAPIASVLAGPTPPAYVEELLAAPSIERAGIFSAGQVGDLFRKCRGGAAVSETDEMALVGVVSTMLLHERFVTSPRPPSAALPVRAVIGSNVVTPPSFPTPLVGAFHVGT